MDWRLRQLRDGDARAALDDPDSVFYAYQSLIRLRKTLPVLTWGDYQDLLPEHPFLWCYRRQWQGQTRWWWLTLAISLMNGNQAFSAVSGRP